MKYRLIKAVHAIAVICIASSVFAAEVKTDTASENIKIEKALRNWFSGNQEEATLIFTQLTGSQCQNPVPYHALAIILSDRRRDYDRIAWLYNRHKVLLTGNAEQYKTVLPTIKEFADKGCSQALLLLSRMTNWGLNGGIANWKAMLLLRRAADGGYDQAQRELGLMYEDGTGVEKDIAKAAQLYSAAAAQGDVFSLKYLAVLALNGSFQGISKHDAVTLLEKAEKAGLPESRLILAQLYRNGIAVKKDEHRAYFWYKKAADTGSTEAMNTLAQMHETGVGAKKIPEQALQWYQKAAALGNSGALFRLGVMYYTGESVKEDHAAAYTYFKEAAEYGNVAAWYNVGWLLKTGDGIKQDLPQAKRWFERSALTGNSRAQLNLGVMYANGEGVKVDLEEARIWFELAKLCGNSDASQGLAYTDPRLDAAAKDRAYRRALTLYKKMRKHLPQ